MEYWQAKAYKAGLEQAEIEASNALNSISGVGSGPMGLTPDSVKSTVEYQSAKSAYDAAFQALRQFNQYFTKAFKKEIVQERKNKYKTT